MAEPTQRAEDGPPRKPQPSLIEKPSATGFWPVVQGKYGRRKTDLPLWYVIGYHTVKKFFTAVAWATGLALGSVMAKLLTDVGARILKRYFP